MPYQLVKTVNSETWIKLSGKLTVQDFEALQALAKSSLECFGQVRILVQLEGFQGWSREPGWETSFFLTENEDRTSKLAFVGDEKWQEDVFMFVGKPMRKSAIEFFTPDQGMQAKIWLAEGNVESIFVD